MLTYEPFTVRDRRRENANRPEPAEIDHKTLGAVVGEIEKALQALNLPEGFNISDERKLILGFLFGDPEKPIKPLSSKELTAQQINGLKQWIGARKMGEVWRPRLGFRDELYWVRSRAQNFNLTSINNGCTISELIESYKKNYEIRQVEIEEKGMVDTALKLGGDLTAIGTTLPDPEKVMYDNHIPKKREIEINLPRKDDSNNAYICSREEF